MKTFQRQIIRDTLDRNTTFNVFGLVNLSNLKFHLNDPSITDKQIKKEVIKMFGHEMNGEIEFK